MIAALPLLLLAHAPPGAPLAPADPGRAAPEAAAGSPGCACAQDPGEDRPQDPLAGAGDAAGEAAEDGDARVRALLEERAERARIDDRYVGEGELPALQAELDELPDDDCFRLGPQEVDDLRFELALSWLRHGETSNCVARHTAKSCLLPIQEEGVHADQEGSRRALELLLELRERRPRDPSAAWLANLAAMTLGEWPAALPEDWRVPAAALESEIDFPRFPEVAAERGLATFDLSGGSVVDDLDGDGVLDVLTSTWDPREGGKERLIHRTVGSGGSFGANPITRTLIGLGRAEVIDELEVRWPTSGTTQTFRDVPVGGAVLVIEGEDELSTP